MEKNSLTLGEYVYDGDGKRIRVTEDNVTTTYVYSGLSVLYEETTTGIACYIYGLTGKLAKRTTINGESNTFYYHTDHLGSTRQVTDSNKNIVTAVTYHPFGESYSEEGSEDYLFTGKEKDSTGLYYYGARHYDPDLGRFLTRDPYSGNLVNPQSLNQYTYCYNNPLLFVDPDGRDPLHYEGPIYYDEEEQTLVYSHAPQLMDYVNCEEDYEWFAFFCIGEGIVFSIVLTSGAITYFFPNAGPAAITFIKWLGFGTFQFIKDHKLAILAQVILFIIQLIISDYLTELEVEQIMSESDSEESASFFGFLAKFEEAWGMKAILVEYNEDGTYTVKFEDDSIRMFKYIDGEWVEIPTSSEGEETS